MALSHGCIYLENESNKTKIRSHFVVNLHDCLERSFLLKSYVLQDHMARCGPLLFVDYALRGVDTFLARVVTFSKWFCLLSEKRSSLRGEEKMLPSVE